MTHIAKLKAKSKAQSLLTHIAKLKAKLKLSPYWLIGLVLIDSYCQAQGRTKTQSILTHIGETKAALGLSQGGRKWLCAL